MTMSIFKINVHTLMYNLLRRIYVVITETGNKKHQLKRYIAETER